MQRGGCGKQRGECKEERSGSEESVLENEDYVYTNSLPQMLCVDVAEFITDCPNLKLATLTIVKDL